jgi:hypothetical protein
MDTTRRWQVATAVTALAGLGLGAAALSGSTTDPVAPIVLDEAGSVTFDVVPSPSSSSDREASIVSAEVREDVVSPPTPISLDSPDEAPSPTPSTGRSPAPSTAPPAPSPRAPSTSGPTPSPTATDDGPDTVSSPDTSGSPDD